MRGKRSKQYRKLMQQYGLTFGFREPYQVLVDAEMMVAAQRFKMDLPTALERTLHGKVKPMITQCSIRHLYALSQSSSKAPAPAPAPSKSNTDELAPLPQYLLNEVINKAKSYERRRCSHHPDEYPAPLPESECMLSVIDPKSSSTNKHNYVVASQDDQFRRTLRSVKGTPLIYVKRSVMIMEPMADASVKEREGTERSKFRGGLKGAVRGEKTGEKRKRDDEDGEGEKGGEEAAPVKKAKKVKGPKGPNPLSMKKPKKEKAKEGAKDTKPASSKATKEREPAENGVDGGESGEPGAGAGDAGVSGEKKRKRTRKRKHATGESAAGQGDDEGGEGREGGEGGEGGDDD